MQHKSEGLRRPCHATDLFLVAGGLQCGNCGAHTVPTVVTCSAQASDGPCPLPPDGADGLCWVHRRRQDCTKPGCTTVGSDRYDGYGIYLARLCDEHYEQDSRREFGRTRRFDPDFAGERLEEDA